MILEICANSVSSAVKAQEGGANRIELCCNLEQGGLTPSAATIQLVKELVSIPIFVLIRPRIGSFSYTPLELKQMCKDILFCKRLGIDGVVFGVLNKYDEIAIAANKDLLEAARPMECTFHRAFDCLENPFEGAKTIVSMGFNRILTSGTKPTAIEGKYIIRKLIQETANLGITILPGSGLSSTNSQSFLAFTGAKELHASAKKTIRPSSSNLFSAMYFETDIEEVKSLSAVIREYPKYPKF